MAFRRFLDRYRLGPGFTNGGGVVPSRPIMRGANSREAELQAELDRLYRERAVLARAEAEGRQNLARLQDQLDILANEIDRKAKASRDRGLAERGAAVISNVRAWADKQDGVGPDTARAAIQGIKIALGVEPSPWTGPAPRAPQGAVVPIDPVKRAAEIVAAGRKARGETLPEKPSDPIAAGIVAAGKRARNEPSDE
jgi:hypothetical protein